MGKVFDVIAGIGVLIAIFLFLTRGNETVQIISAIGGTTANMIKSLQGRG